jgi:hypothetical protein
LHIRQMLTSLVQGALSSLGMTTISKRELTVTRMNITVVRLSAYWKTNRRLPTTLAELGTLPGRDNSTVDGWGSPIRYEITGATTGTLVSSAGSDARPGLVISFDVAHDDAGV